jgi:hypothetical protein
VRGAALPLLAWGTLLVVLMTLNWIWTGDAIQVGSFAFAAAVVLGGGLLAIALWPREALRRGDPPRPVGPEAIPTSSAGAVMVAIGFASVMFGLAFGRFLIYFGAGLVVTALGVLWREHKSEREARLGWEEESGGEH